MNKPIALIGVGEMGGVFARGFLRAGYPVYPITRDMNINQVAEQLTDIEAVLVGVGEKDLNEVLTQLPEQWKDKVILVQNELLPNDWIAQGIADPTVISVWFEKKQPNDYKVIIPSPVFGPKAELIKSSLESINIAVNVVSDIDALTLELVLKNLYILTTNISGLEVGGNVGQLWEEHNALARTVANDVLDIQFKLAGKELDREALIEGMVKAFEGDREHKCMGRSAPARLARAIELSDQFALETKKLREIASNQTNAV